MRSAKGWLLLLMIAGGAALSSYATAAGDDYSVRVLYTLPSGEVQSLPGASVTLLSQARKPLQQQTTDETGTAVLAAVAAGEYLVQAEMAGFRTTTQRLAASPDAPRTLDVTLPLEEITASLTVNAETEREDTQRPELPATLKQQLIKSAPLANERFQEALPLVPGVVKGPDGLLSMNGARPSQSGLLVNSVNATDPVTGQFAMELPLEAVERVQVYASPYAAEFGKFTGAVTTIETHQGANDWKFLFTNFMPRLRYREGKIRGFESFTPRFALSGPLIKDKLWFSQHLEYRFILTEVPSLPELENETQLETFDSFTRLDWQINPDQRLTSILSVYPQNLKWVGLDTFHPQESTPNFDQRGFFVAFNHNAIINFSSLLETTFSVKKYDAHIYPNSYDELLITPEGWRGGYYNNQDRYSNRFELSQTYTAKQRRWLGVHDPKVGYTVSRLTYHGDNLGRPLEVQRENTTRSQYIEFLGSTRVECNAWEFTMFAQDRWRIGAPVTLDYGLRLDWDSIARRMNFAPRVGLALLPFPSSARTVVRAGCGLFYDKIPLNTAVFDQYQKMRVTSYAADGVTPEGNPLTYDNLVLDGRLSNPYAFMWNVEVDHEPVDGLMLRAGYRQRQSWDEIIIQPMLQPSPALLIGNTGDQKYSELLLGAKYKFRGTDEVGVSYIRSKSRGNLNSYEMFLGNFMNPIVRPDEYGPLPHDVPNRLLATATVSLPWGIVVFPVLEVRDGFPYSLVDENQNFVGPRNQGGRFPTYLSLDMQIVKKVKIKFMKRKWNTRIGVKLFNVTNHWNPRDVQNNVDSPNFGTFYNSIGTTVRGKFEIDF